MNLAARIRSLYWRRIRRYRYEICGEVGRQGPAYATIHRHGCGRPVRVVWRAPTGLWNYVVTGQTQTVYTVRVGSASGRQMRERAEGAGGILCLNCFDRLARQRDVHVRWVTHTL